MDLGTVRSRLGKTHFSHYQSVEEFVADVQLIFTNCSTFNPVSCHTYVPRSEYRNSKYIAQGAKIIRMLLFDIFHIFTESHVFLMSAWDVLAHFYPAIHGMGGILSLLCLSFLSFFHVR